VQLVSALQQAQEPELARVWRPLVLEHAGLEEPPSAARGPEASLPRVDAQLAREVQPRELQLEARVGAQPLWPRLLSRRVRLRQRFRRPPHPSSGA